MSWTDLKSTETICKLRDEFNVNEFIETGTYKGVNAKYYSQFFNKVLTSEINPIYIEHALTRLMRINNVNVFKKSSPIFLKEWAHNYRVDKREDYVIIYLDAHFYDSKASPAERFVVLNELAQLINFDRCILVIHDFDNGELGHITYDGVSLDFKLLENDLLKVNPNFKFYTNTKDGCDIIKSGQEVKGIDNDEELETSLKFIWSKPEKTYRGILYCVPKELDLSKYNLVKHG